HRPRLDDEDFLGPTPRRQHVRVSLQAPLDRARVVISSVRQQLFILISLAFVGCCFGETTNSFVPTTKYATTRVAGWTVRVNRELLASQSELGSNALALLKVKLIEITNTVPPRACEALKRVTIWL